MPCCCASNIKAAKIIGIILAVLYALHIIFFITTADTFAIITTCLGLVNASILAFGAHTRNSRAMLIFMGGTILLIILNNVWIVLTTKSLANETCIDKRGTNQTDILDWGTNSTDIELNSNQFCETAFVGFSTVIGVGFLIFDIWTIIVAKNAKKEIEAEQSTPVQNLTPYTVSS